ncbi:9564_t:CDS:2, partial [Dentiscutata heterogama]
TQTDQYAAFNVLTSAWRHVDEHIDDKIKTPLSLSPTDTMHLVGFRAMANNINKLACLTLLREPEDSDPVISTAVDYINSVCFMYLDNDLFVHSLYNGSIGIIIKLINKDTINIVFPAPLRMITAT